MFTVVLFSNKRTRNQNFADGMMSKKAIGDFEQAQMLLYAGIIVLFRIKSCFEYLMARGDISLHKVIGR